MCIGDHKRAESIVIVDRAQFPQQQVELSPHAPRSSTVAAAAAADVKVHARCWGPTANRRVFALSAKVAGTAPRPKCKPPV
jgi:hypothetical protein